MSQAGTEDRIGYLVKRAAQSFRQTCDGPLRELGLSMAQYAVLTALAELPGAPSAELARRTFVTRQSLRDVLAGLRAAGHVEVAQRAATGRALPVTLTDSGRQALDRAESVVRAVERQMLTGLAADDTQRLAHLLRHCVANLDPPPH